MTSFLAKIYAFKFFDSFILIFPLYAVMFVDAGLSPVEISVALTAWSVTTFVLQIPAGMVADRFSRRHVLALAQAGRAAGFVLWLVWPHFWGFFIGLVLWGCKSAFTSGTFEALLFDELKAQGREGQYTRLIGRAQAVQALGVLAASLCAAAVARFGYPVALVASLAAIALASLAALALPPADRTLLAHDQSYLGQFRQGLVLALGHRVILHILVFAALAVALGGALEEFWPIFGVKIGLSHPAVALFVGVQYAAEAVASLLAHRTGRFGARAFYILFAVAGAALLTAGALFVPSAMALLALYSALMKVVDVVFEGRLQQAIPSNQRATIGSVKGFAAQIGISTLYMGFGPLAQATSYRVAFMACGVTGIVIGVAYLGWSLNAKSAQAGPA
ncbi:MAG: MFS transporter [Caulobacteraceae bacterium]|nr:MFS transporter [Caulobacteraceae bacterium]